MNNSVQRAVAIVREGGIVIFPTDTAFGIGCRLDKPRTVNRLFSIRKRPLTQATPVLVDSVDMALAYFDSPDDIVRHYMKLFWPGALTIVAPCKTETIYSPIRGGGKNIGLRMPDHKITLEIIRETGVPVLGPSANFHGDPTPYRTEDLSPLLIKLVDYVVPGACSVGQASTVVDCSSDPPKIIRQGSVIVDTYDH